MKDAIPLDHRVEVCSNDRDGRSRMLRATGGIQPLQSLFSSLKFEIPDFQRNFAWEDRQISEFWDDLLFTISHPRSSHFVGSVILLNDGREERAQIIDGQQRITTIIMTYAILRDFVVANENATLQPESAGAMPINVLFHLEQLLFAEGFPRFEANAQVKKRFLDCVLRDPVSDPARSKFKKSEQSDTLRLRKAYWQLQELIASYLDQHGGQDPTNRLRSAWEITRALSQRLVILRIDCEDQLEAIGVYMTLNNRGLGLTPADLLKSLIMKHLGSGLFGQKLKEQNNLVIDSWNELVEIVGESRLNQFLRHYLLVYGPPGESVREKDIFRFFQQMIEGSTRLTEAEVRARAEDTFLDLQRVSSIYGHLLEPDNSGFNKETTFRIKSLNELMDSHRVFLIAAFDAASAAQSSNFDELVRMVDILSTRWILAGENAQLLENFFQAMSRRILDRKLTLDVKTAEVLEQFKLQCPTDAIVTNRLRESTFSIPLARFILSRINEVLHHHMGVIDYAAQKVNVEHIAPQSASDFWFASLGLDPNDQNANVLYKEMISRLGNLTLLEYKLNQSIRNGPWEQKRNGIPGKQDKSYADTVLKVAIDVRNQELWTDKQIENRTNWLIETFLKIWSFDGDLNITEYS